MKRLRLCNLIYEITKKKPYSILLFFFLFFYYFSYAYIKKIKNRKMSSFKYELDTVSYPKNDVTCND